MKYSEQSISTRRLLCEFEVTGDQEDFALCERLCDSFVYLLRQVVKVAKVSKTVVWVVPLKLPKRTHSTVQLPALKRSYTVLLQLVKLKGEKKMALYRIWWIPQVPMPAMRVEVENLVEAKLLLDTLATYDRFQYEQRIKEDYCNAGGLEVYDPESEDWFDWYCEKTGEDINSSTLSQLREQQHLSAVNKVSR